MLKAIKNLFTREKGEVGLHSDNQYEPRQPSSPNFLTDRHKVAKLLLDLESVAPLCTITIDGSTELFSSSILEIKSDENQIILDELIPEHGNNLLHGKRSLKLSTHFKGIHLAFTLDKIQFGSSRGIAYYVANFPDRIYYPQRRKAPRLEITAINIPFSGIADKNKISIGGVVFDLSRTGIGINLTNNRPRIQRGDTLKQCRIILDGHNLDFNLAIRFVKKINAAGIAQTNIGGNFENLSNKSQNKLSYFIAALEREEIRKQKT